MTLAAANFALFGRLSVMANRTPVIGRWFFVSILAVFAHEMCHFRPDAEGESVRNLYHRHPTEKTGKKVTTIEEAQKCDLLCANCHREAHRNMPWKKGGGRPKSASDSLLEPYMRLSGLPDAVITDALSGR